MNSGFITSKRVIKRLGIHQRFDEAAYHMIEHFLPHTGAAPGRKRLDPERSKPHYGFPEIRDIIYFEGYNGPDGLKVKSPGVHEPSHLYDPVTDSGEVPVHITNHYAGLVRCLKDGDMIRGAFEASWLAHYVCDGLTPAHHWPLEEKIAEAVASADNPDVTRFTNNLKKNWAIFGIKGHLSTHLYFETGIAFALLSYHIRPVFSDEELARARQLGAVEYFKDQARDIASLHLYDHFYKDSWSAELMSSIKNKVAPQTARTIGLIWLLAVLDAGEQLASGKS